MLLIIERAALDPLLPQRDAEPPLDRLQHMQRRRRHLDPDALAGHDRDVERVGHAGQYCCGWLLHGTAVPGPLTRPGRRRALREDR